MASFCGLLLVAFSVRYTSNSMAAVVSPNSGDYCGTSTDSLELWVITSQILLDRFHCIKSAVRKKSRQATSEGSLLEVKDYAA